jgi:hypothetical protein
MKALPIDKIDFGLTSAESERSWASRFNET